MTEGRTRLTWLFSFLLLFLISRGYSQIPCNNFTGEVILIEKSDSIDYDFIPRSISFPTSLPLIIRKTDSLHIRLFDNKGNLVYSRGMDSVKADDYILTFINSNCEGVFFLIIQIGETDSAKRIISLKKHETSQSKLDVSIETKPKLLTDAGESIIQERMNPHSSLNQAKMEKM